jgi:CheY-like chemotaxis protein
MMKRIVVIESDPAVRKLLGLALLKRGYQVTLAENDDVGFETALFVKPQLIVTDIQSATGDDIRIIRDIRETPALAKVPILVTTAFGTGTATFSLQQGANGYEPRPIDERSFVTTVERLLAESDSVKAA